MWIVAGSQSRCDLQNLLSHSKSLLFWFSSGVGVYTVPCEVQHVPNQDVMFRVSCVSTPFPFQIIPSVGSGSVNICNAKFRASESEGLSDETRAEIAAT